MTDHADPKEHAHDHYYYMGKWHILADWRSIYDAEFYCGLLWLSRDQSLSARVALRNDIEESQHPVCDTCESEWSNAGGGDGA